MRRLHKIITKYYGCLYISVPVHVRGQIYTVNIRIVVHAQLVKHMLESFSPAQFTLTITEMAEATEAFISLKL